jgi:hypothetical protein
MACPAPTAVITGIMVSAKGIDPALSSLTKAQLSEH